MLKHFNFLRITFLLAILASVPAMVSVEALSNDFILELTIITDKEEEFVQIIELNDREFRNLKNDTNREIQNYLLEARKKYADEIGYRREIYGNENFKMVVIAKFTFVVKDKTSGRILLAK
jgi:hypothetical protein